VGTLAVALGRESVFVTLPALLPSQPHSKGVRERVGQGDASIPHPYAIQAAPDRIPPKIPTLVSPCGRPMADDLATFT